MRQPTKLYRLFTWSHGTKYYAEGREPVRLTRFFRSASRYPRSEAREIAKRFRKVNTRMKLEEAA